MVTTNRTKLNKLYAHWPPGAPMTSEDLAARGMSADLTFHYVRTGWLRRLMRGVYCKPNEPLALYPSLLLLQRQFEGLHVGGKSALDWNGVRHYVLAKASASFVRLAGGENCRGMVHRAFPGRVSPQASLRRKARTLAACRTLRKAKGRPLSIGTRAGATGIVERRWRAPAAARGLANSSRAATPCAPDVLRHLLQHCTNVKTVRLCLTLGKELSLPWAKKLDAATLPTGSRRRWVSKSADGLLVLKP